MPSHPSPPSLAHSHPQGFVEIYSGQERSAKVARLLPGTRYTFKIMVRALQ